MKKTKLILAMVFLLLSSIGFRIGFPAFQSIYKHAVSSGWERIECMIERVEYVNPISPDNKLRTPLLESTYSYTYQGRNYRGNQVFVDPIFDIKGVNERLKNSQLALTPWKGYMNPDNPEDVFLVRGLDLSRLTLRLAVFVFLILGGAVFYVVYYRLAEKK